MIQKLLFGLVIGLLSASAVSIQISAQGRDNQTIRARADIRGAAGSNITGEATFEQNEGGILPTVLVRVRVRGLAPNSVHGVHIHEVGRCEANFTSAGNHFDPGAYGRPALDNHPFHMGDIPNLVANRRGVATLEYRTSRITLSPGLLSIFDDNGSAIVVHAEEDKGQPNLAGGGRIGCGVIQTGTR